MDLRPFMGTNYINIDDIVANGPRQETIVDIQPGNYGRPDLYFESGARLSLNTTNTKTLARAYGTDSKGSIGKTIELIIGEVDFKGEKQKSVLVRPISPGSLNQEPSDDIPF